MTGWQLLLGGLVLTAMGFAGGGHFVSFGLGATALLAYLAALSAIAFGSNPRLRTSIPTATGTPCRASRSP